MMKMKSLDEKKREERWKYLMEWGDRVGCHQMPERSFFYKGYQFPVCARCTGVILGSLIAVPVFFLTGFHKGITWLSMSSMWVDWVLQKAEVLESTNKRRLITGIAGGFGVMSVQLAVLQKLFNKFKKTS